MIAVSEFTKRELVVLLDVPEARIRVVPNGVEDVFTPDGPRADGDYVLAVGTLEPRKNLARIAAGGRRRSFASWARAAGAVSMPPANVTWLGDVSDESSPRCTAARAASSTPPSTRASASRSPRRLRAAARS